MQSIPEQKAALRRLMLGARDAIPLRQQDMAARALVAWLETARFRAMLPAPGGIIAGFMPMRSEISPLPLMHALAQEGFRLALPRVTPEGLVFHAHAWGDPLVPGPFGTREPPAGAPHLLPDLVLAPLLAFDAAGGRLGYGKGYYDRFFVQNPAVRRIGLAHAMQEVALVPRAAQDAILETVFTG